MKRSSRGARSGSRLIVSLEGLFRYLVSASCLVVLMTEPAVAQTPFTPLRINAGGAAYTDSSGNAWSADTGYNTGNVSTRPASTPIYGTSDPTLYQSARWDSSTAPILRYSFAVPNGSYDVTLHFAESSSGIGTGDRIFHVQMEGATVISNLDVFAEAGGNTALAKTTTITVSDGQIDIDFPHGPIENPFVNAIEIHAAGRPFVSALSALPTQVDLRWTTSGLDAVQFLIERCEGVGCSSFSQIAVTGLTSYVDTAVTSQATYRYRVRVQRSDTSLSDYSSIATVSTPRRPR